MGVKGPATRKRNKKRQADRIESPSENPLREFCARHSHDLDLNKSLKVMSATWHSAVEIQWMQQMRERCQIASSLSTELLRPPQNEVESATSQPTKC